MGSILTYPVCEFCRKKEKKLRTFNFKKFDECGICGKPTATRAYFFDNDNIGIMIAFLQRMNKEAYRKFIHELYFHHHYKEAKPLVANLLP